MSDHKAAAKERMLLIQSKARELKQADPNLKHKDAIVLASTLLREQGHFSKPKRTRKRKNSMADNIEMLEVSQHFDV